MISLCRHPSVSEQQETSLPEKERKINSMSSEKNRKRKNPESNLGKKKIQGTKSTKSWIHVLIVNKWMNNSCFQRSKSVINTYQLYLWNVFHIIHCCLPPHATIRSGQLHSHAHPCAISYLGGRLVQSTRQTEMWMRTLLLTSCETLGMLNLSKFGIPHL